ncbi:hypothetical protein HYH02_000771 [Chlamydomonas schloesseri]|uniref:Uncharacterized protein n=1 Tax=Chlamydomonas schloesseri TaxID=2026947 RepID=A0A836BD78_9CHLO|nr:hypothetical protein HYH02_000771 [Chlamydomonas schloesseri]|eukprot:KAG2454943.1 hypothetical protein HYH02_000771 [Chlamydomonas schloesseri]
MGNSSSAKRVADEPADLADEPRLLHGGLSDFLLYNLWPGLDPADRASLRLAHSQLSSLTYGVIDRAVLAPGSEEEAAQCLFLAKLQSARGPPHPVVTRPHHTGGLHVVLQLLDQDRLLHVLGGVRQELLCKLELCLHPQVHKPITDVDMATQLATVVQALPNLQHLCTTNCGHLCSASTDALARLPHLETLSCVLYWSNNMRFRERLTRLVLHAEFLELSHLEHLEHLSHLTSLTLSCSMTCAKHGDAAPLAKLGRLVELQLCNVLANMRQAHPL